MSVVFFKRVSKSINTYFFSDVSQDAFQIILVLDLHLIHTVFE